MSLARRSLLGAMALLPLAKASKASPSDWPGALVMGTGQPGNAFTAYGPAWGALITEATGTQIVYRSTNGSGPNLLLIEEGKAQLGLCSLPVAIQGHSGTSPWTAGAKLEQFRVLFPAFPSILQIVSTVNGPTSLAALSDQAIGVGPAGASSSMLMKKILASQGVLPSQIDEADYPQQMEKLTKGELAACAFFGAPPVPAIKTMALGNRLHLIGFSEAEAQQAARFVPGLTRMTLKAGTFPGQSLAVTSIGTFDLAVGTATLPDSLAAAATLAALKRRAQLGLIVPAAARPLSMHLLRHANLPFHPGAAKVLAHLGFG